MNTFTRLIFSVLCVILFFSEVSGQKISGVVSDAAGKPQEFVTVMLMQSKDSALVKGAVTDATGSFEFEKIPKGNYFTRTSMVGFKNTDSKPMDYDGSNLSLEKITLGGLNNELKEVTVTANKPLIEIQADKLVFNVDASPTNTGLNALELLRKSPGVTLDQNDNIALKGVQNVIVQINGKITPMSGTDLAQFLKGLNSADIEAIEIISNPGAKYDAEGSAGIINIRLKKDRKMGTNGSFNIGLYQGITTKGDASISLNHRGKKLNIFGSASTFRGRWDNSLHIDNQISSNDSRYNQNSSMYWNNKPQNGRFGMDYSPDSKNTIGFLVTGGLFVPTNSAVAQTDIGKLSSDSRDSFLLAQTAGRLHNWNSNFNINYKFADTLGNELNFDADYGIFRDSSMTLNSNAYYTSASNQLLSTTIYRYFTPRDIDIKSIKADYSRPLSIAGKKNVKLGFGFKVSDVSTNNRFKFYDVLNDIDVFDTDRSNNFIYHEKITAGYANLNTKIKKMSFQLGLRVEHTNSNGSLEAFKVVNDKTVNNDYTSAFPSVAVGYEVTKNFQLNLTYRHSIDRPRYQDLNPFEYRLDELSFRKGNSFLRPQFTSSIELSSTLFQRANMSIKYSKTNDAFANISDQEIDSITGKQRFYIQARNLAVKENVGLSINTPIPINSWWNGNANIYYNYSILRANYGDGRMVDIKTGGGGLWMQQVFTLSKTLTAEISGNYNAGGTWGAYINKPQGSMDIGVSKKLWDGNGTLRLSFTDIFHTSQWAAYTTLGSLYIDASGTYEGQQVKANFTYRFGNKNVKNARERATGLEDENKRVGG